MRLQVSSFKDLFFQLRNKTRGLNLTRDVPEVLVSIGFMHVNYLTAFL